MGTPRKTWPIEVRQRARELRNAGFSFQRISDETGASIGAVRNWLNPKTPKAWPYEVQIKCLEMRKCGMTYKAITAATGVPDSTQRDWYPEPLRSFRGKKSKPVKPLSLSSYITHTEYKGVKYKIGNKNRLFYQDFMGVWLRSTLRPCDVGLM